MKNYKFAFYTKKEEQLNAWSHFAGIIIGIAVGILLLRRTAGERDVFAVMSIALYLSGMLASYITSTLYHRTLHRSRWKPVLRRWDHAAIYWHIAGSYSPITLIGLRDVPGWGISLFVFVWLCAIAGTIVSFRGLKRHSNLETICFVSMGLIILVAFKPLLDHVSKEVLLWIFAEGVFYITGALFYSLPSRRYMHSVFHFFVLAGTLCHLAAVWNIV